MGVVYSCCGGRDEHIGQPVETASSSTSPSDGQKPCVKGTSPYSDTDSFTKLPRSNSDDTKEEEERGDVFVVAEASDSDDDYDSEEEFDRMRREEILYVKTLHLEPLHTATATIECTVSNDSFGVTIASVSPLSFHFAHGCYVDQVEHGTDAHKAGLKIGDNVVFAAGTRVTNMMELLEASKAPKPFNMILTRIKPTIPGRAPESPRK